ncbi:MAG TPA: LCP family protein [Actinomycetota bacterium]|jgi:LCP family protein required for cell wall assembly|nr:LCP family protein [Actinomycetota bacterium]
MTDPKPTAGAAPAATSERPPTPGGGGGSDGGETGPSRRGFILRQVGFAVAGTLAALLAVGALAGIWLLNYVERNVNQTAAGTDRETLPGEPMNVLVLGSDSRARLSEKEQATKGGPEDVEGQRSDTIILAHFDPERNKAVLVHFPRDLRVEIPGHGEGKINEAFHLGGPKLMVRTVKRFTGLNIHHYVEVDFVGFEGLVDALGGVRMCVDRPMFDELAELRIPRAGCYRFDGDMSLAFVRARHVEGDLIPDFSRIARQQQFIRALLNKLLSVNSLVRLPSLIRLATDNVTTDDQLSGAEILFLGAKLRELAQQDPTGARTVDLRVVPSVPQDIDGISYVVAEQPEASKLFRALELGKRLRGLGTVQALTSVSPGVIEVWVLDTGNPEAAALAESRLRGAGFIVRGIRKSPSGLRRSAILFRPEGEAWARTVSGFFPDLPQRDARARVLAGADVAVVIGADWGGLSA